MKSDNHVQAIDGGVLLRYSEDKMSSVIRSMYYLNFLEIKLSQDDRQAKALEDDSVHSIEFRAIWLCPAKPVGFIQHI